MIGNRVGPGGNGMFCLEKIHVNAQYIAIAEIPRTAKDAGGVYQNRERKAYRHILVVRLFTHQKHIEG